MELMNNVTYFVLMNLTQNQNKQKVLFVMFLFFYILTLVGIMLIVVTVAFMKTLGSLMHFFLVSSPFIL